jgi:hypothetical protein
MQNLPVPAWFARASWGHASYQGRAAFGHSEESLSAVGVRFVWWTGVLCLAFAACRPASGRRIAVQITSTRSPLVSVAERWTASGSILEPRREGNAFWATVAHHEHPVPFIDLDEDGRLDLGAEPTAVCRREADKWSCDMEPARLFVHRSQTGVDDSTTVFGEAYDPATFAVDAKARLCLTDQDRCIAERLPGPYLDASFGLMLKLCDITSQSGPETAHEVALFSGDRVLIRTRASQPPAMGIKARVQRENDRYAVTGTTSLEIHRLIVWVGEVVAGETKSILWSSQQAPDLLRVEHSRFQASVPVSRLEGCRACSIGVQAVHDVQKGKVSVSSEGVAFLEPGEAL